MPKRTLGERDNWQLLDAVKENRVYILDSDIASGPRYLVGLAELAAWLYPDASVPSGKRIHEEWANAAWMPMYKEDDGGQG